MGFFLHIIPHFMGTKQNRQVTAFLTGSSPAPAWMFHPAICLHSLPPIPSHPESNCTLTYSQLLQWKKKIRQSLAPTFPLMLGIMSAGKRNTDLSLCSISDVNSVVHWILDLLHSGYIFKVSLPHTVHFYFALLLKFIGLDVRAYVGFC